MRFRYNPYKVLRRMPDMGEQSGTNCYYKEVTIITESSLALWMEL